MKRQYIHREPIAVQPTRLEAGEYLTLSDYARSKGLTRLTIYNMVKRGDLVSVRVGNKALLIRI